MYSTALSSSSEPVSRMNGAASAIELRQIVVGNDEIGTELAQGALELGLRRDPSRRELQARLAQLDLHQLSIGPHVLQQEDAHGHVQFLSPSWRTTDERGQRCLSASA